MPKSHLFQPGVSGNPNGRPKGSLGFSAKLKKIAMQPDPDNPGKTIGDKLMKVIADAAAAGDFKFMEMFLNRTVGKVPDRNINVDGGSLGNMSSEDLKDIIDSAEDDQAEPAEDND